MSDAMSRGLNRREFLTRVAWVSAMHAGLWEGGEAFAADLVRPAMRLRRLHLKAPDLEALVPFYREALRLPVEATAEKVVVTAGYSEIEFTQSVAGEKPFYHFAFTIPDNQLRNAMAWLEPRCAIANIRNTQEKIIQFRNWDAESCYFFDPAGNILEFIAHRPLKNGTNAAFSEEQILHVSEIGLVVPDVPTMEAQVRDKIGLTAYRGSSKNFAPIGDLHGLLIVVPQQRAWLPTTDVLAAVYETGVEAEGLDGEYAWDDLPYQVRRYR